jgi:dipeptidyl aminopeptidase/acylaminoacyl peptidase
MGLAIMSYSQPLTLEYIFQDPQIINPRPSLKQMNPLTNKIYYYGDDDFDGRYSMFDYNYETGETFKYSDTGDAASEFVIMKNGDAVSIIKGDLYISKNFAVTREYSKDITLTETDGYEYSPLVSGNYIIYRRSGNYYILKLIDGGTKHTNEIALTKDECDTVSYQIIGFGENSDGAFRISFARYDNTSKEEYLFPDYTGEHVRVTKKKRGISKVKLIEEVVSAASGSSITLQQETEIKYPGETRYSTIFSDYSPDASSIVLDVETMDRHTRKLFVYNTSSRQINEIYSETDTAWYERHYNPTTFLDNDEIFFDSEVSGYNNLYKINKDGSGFKMLAGGSFSILESVLNTKDKKIYFNGNKEEPYEYFIYETDFGGSYLHQLTSIEGEDEELKISPDGKHVFYEHSFINKPNEIYMLNTEDYTSKQVTNSVSDKFAAINWKIPEVITFPNSEDSHTLYAFLYKPDNFNPKKKYPLICFAHGEGYLQNVTYGFSPYQDNYMVNTFLTQQGYMVLDIDFRGSKGYGKEHRNKTYRNMGYWEVSDYISGVNYLDNLGVIDRNRVGIYGGSYGGFITLMATFRHPEIFKAGVALRPVCSWKNYYYSNKWYTLARLGAYNDENKYYYEISSPITYADNLQVPLLITHGMLDDNVYFQDMVQLTQKLIELGKDFDIMIYPKEAHAFYMQADWLDQYKRINKFFKENLKP